MGESVKEIEEYDDDWYNIKNIFNNIRYYIDF